MAASPSDPTAGRGVSGPTTQPKINQFREDQGTQEATHTYGRDGEDPVRQLRAENPDIAEVVLELTRRGAVYRDEAEMLLPQLEVDMGELTETQRRAVLAQYKS